MCRARLADGSARFTIDESSTTISWAMAMTPRACHRLGSGTTALRSDGGAPESTRTAFVVSTSLEPCNMRMSLLVRRLPVQFSQRHQVGLVFRVESDNRWTGALGCSSLAHRVCSVHVRTCGPSAAGTPMRPCVYQARHADNLHPFIPLISDAESMTPEVLSWIGARPASVMAAVALALSLWTLWRSRTARLQPAPFATFHQSTERAQPSG